MELPVVSYAQNGEDVVLRRALGHLPTGRFVDVGAYHPVEDSVTRVFVLAGWRGVHVEPVPELADCFLEEYPDADVVRAVVSDSGQTEAVLHRVAGTGLSSLSEAVAASSDARGFARDAVVVPVMTLEEISARPAARDEHGQTHFLKVDVEGAEAAVLRSADLSSWRPWVLCVESMTPGRSGQSHEEWEPRLVAAGYRFCLFDGVSRFYVAEERSELAPALSYPACVLDHYEFHHVTRMRDELAASGAYASRLEEELVTRSAYVRRLEEELATRSAYVRRVEEELETRSAYAARLEREVADAADGVALSGGESSPRRLPQRVDTPPGGHQP